MCCGRASADGFTAPAKESQAKCAVLVKTKQSECTSAAQSLQTQVQTSVGVNDITNPHQN